MYETVVNETTVLAAERMRLLSHRPLCGYASLRRLCGADFREIRCHVHVFLYSETNAAINGRWRVFRVDALLHVRSCQPHSMKPVVPERRLAVFWRGVFPLQSCLIRPVPPMAGQSQRHLGSILPICDGLFFR